MWAPTMSQTAASVRGHRSTRARSQRALPVRGRLPTRARGSTTRTPPARTRPTQPTVRLAPPSLSARARAMLELTLHVMRSLDCRMGRRPRVWAPTMARRVASVRGHRPTLARGTTTPTPPARARPIPPTAQLAPPSLSARARGAAEPTPRATRLLRRRVGRRRRA